MTLRNHYGFCRNYRGLRQKPFQAQEPNNVSGRPLEGVSEVQVSYDIRCFGSL